MILAKRIESPKMIRYRYDHFDSRKNKDYTSEEDIKLLDYIKNKSRIDWTILLINFKYEQYIWRFYPTLKRNFKFATISRQLELGKRNNSTPNNIIFIVYLINKMTCFNARIRYYFYILDWGQKIFLYYNRYYRYLANNRKFGKKKILQKKNSHKVHFVACIYHRQLTGIRLERNHLRY